MKLNDIMSDKLYIKDLNKSILLFTYLNNNYKFINIL